MHLIVGVLHLLMKTFCREANQNPSHAFVITYPSLSPVVPTSARAVEMCSILKTYWNILKSKSILYITVPWIKTWDNKSLKKYYPSSGRKGNLLLTLQLFLTSSLVDLWLQWLASNILKFTVTVRIVSVEVN